MSVLDDWTELETHIEVRIWTVLQICDKITIIIVIYVTQQIVFSTLGGATRVMDSYPHELRQRF